MQSKQYYDENQKINTDPREQRQQANRMNRPGHTKNYVFLLALLLIVLLAGRWLLTTGSNTTQQSASDRTFMLTGHSQLIVNDGNGMVSVHASNTDRITVHSTKFASGFGANFDDIQTNYVQNGNTINISTNGNIDFFALGSRGVNLDITVPSSIDLTLNTGSGRVNLADIAGQTRASTGSGDIEASNISGQVALSTGSGNIQINQATLSGQNSISTGSGNIQASQATLSGQDSIHTGSGNIHLTGSLAPNGNYRLETGSGNIQVSVPTTTAFQLTTRLGSGELRNSFGSNQVGSSPYAILSIQTGSGNIELDKQ